MIFVLAGCSTMMTVNAVDQQGMPVQGANVMVDGEHIGQTPEATISVSNFVGRTPLISVTAEGFVPRSVEAVRELKVGPLIGGTIVWPLWLWMWGPRSQQNVVLIPLMPAQ